ncbi:SAM-dependent methyltransferase [Dactylosporangium vinaceum]|uniref:SAM-dependent methyltransferase n=1 Tax=Dactylosporangium vinaceum TaxID=53362 RepID=A0ABV5M010_9ACTN|nr:SAM-dependent methyltransferase [Dactylosporangium vinaceum]UAB94366.1 SAM-dependent methyltransferase [Dactylosporangium vinaceum]
MDTTDDARTRIDTTVAHPARRYNYWLGGKDHFAADRASGDAIAAAMPGVKLMAVENRAFMGRAVRYLAEQGIRQFLDIGTGIPAPNNTHEIAQSVDPSSRVVYVDNDPIVLTHARALLTSAPGGANAYIDGDLRDPEAILAHPDLPATLDLSRPVALLLVAVLHFIREDEHPERIIETLTAALAPGSYLVASHATWEYLPAEVIAALTRNNTDGRFQARTGARFAELLAPFDLVEPGIESVAYWHADDVPGPRPSAEEVACFGAVARIR